MATATEDGDELSLSPARRPVRVTCKNGCRRVAERRGLCSVCYDAIPHPSTPRVAQVCDVCSRKNVAVVRFGLRAVKFEMRSAGSILLCERCWRDIAKPRMLQQRRPKAYARAAG